SLVSRKGDRAEQRILRLARVKSRVLDDNRYIGLDETGEIPVHWNRRWVRQIVKAHVSRALGRNEQPIGPDGRLVCIEDRNRDVGVMRARV
ncbi:MAG TPA: hypothetical protein VH681_14860, partial [Nitrospiraceae bacterium]